MKKIQDMSKPELIFYVHNNQSILFNKKSELAELKSMNFDDLYNLAERIENKINALR